jgi:putative SOS response-associated peptidase YedK
MCGRAAQTEFAIRTAAEVLGANRKNASTTTHGSLDSSSRARTDATAVHKNNSASTRDNYNMSPGMDAVVFWLDRTTRDVKMDRKVWGLVTRGGTQASPVATGMGQHFSNQMFNARSDTLYQRPTFSKLLSTGKTCVIALDGFFEWKAVVKGKKQPYYVYGSSEETESLQNERPHLLVAGLWTTVPTGRPDDPTLDTFTIVTTDVCPSLKWLHTRMPVCIWDASAARQWLERPTQQLFRQLEQGASQTPDGLLKWHAVTPEMTSMKFRSKDAIAAIPKPKTIESFFAVQDKSPAAPRSSSPSKLSPSNAPLKRNAIASQLDSPTPPRKSAKKTVPTPTPSKSSILHFFKPREKD